jgi:hypothetical protein
MMFSVMVLVALFFVVARLRLLQKLWRCPLKNGEEWFLAQRVPEGFYQEAGAALLRRYRLVLAVPLMLDLPLAVWLILARRYVFLDLEQMFAMVATIVLYNVLVVHFSARASLLVGDQEERPATSVQLSMEPRRLRDHTNAAVEMVVVTTTLVAIALVALGGLAAGNPLIAFLSKTHASAHAFRQGIVLTIWVLYWQTGFLLLKGVYVRWRMPLPARRTEEFRRWRSAWLTHHLRIFDAVRMYSAAVLLVTVVWFIYGEQWSRSTRNEVILVAVLVLAVYIVYVKRESRRLAAIQKELKPHELVKEFPRPQIARGRFLAGGLLFFNRDNPGVLVRSPGGIALNLAHPSTYAWAAYFGGLIVLMTWMAR